MTFFREASYRIIYFIDDIKPAQVTLQTHTRFPSHCPINGANFQTMESLQKPWYKPRCVASLIVKTPGVRTDINNILVPRIALCDFLCISDSM